jgi:hypothetical protein
MRLLSKSALLARAGARASTRSEYLGWVFARYSDIEQKTEQELADLLGASANDLRRLRLCLRPRSKSFAVDVQQIAGKFELDARNLAIVIRHVEALEGMQNDRSAREGSEIGVLMAARARRTKSRSPGRRK